MVVAIERYVAGSPLLFGFWFVDIYIYIDS